MMEHNQITSEWIEKMRNACDAATPGPWESKHYGRYEDHDECCIALTDDSIEPSKYANADFIAAARTALPAALDEIERLAADNRKLREAHELAQSGYGTYAHTGNENAPSGTESEDTHVEKN